MGFSASAKETLKPTVKAVEAYLSTLSAKDNVEVNNKLAYFLFVFGNKEVDILLRISCYELHKLINASILKAIPAPYCLLMELLRKKLRKATNVLTFIRPGLCKHKEFCHFFRHGFNLRFIQFDYLWIAVPLLPGEPPIKLRENKKK